MVGDTKVNMLMIRKKVKEYFTGQMAENMKVDGKMENNMEEVFIKDLMEFREKENGEMEKK